MNTISTADIRAYLSSIQESRALSRVTVDNIRRIFAGCPRVEVVSSAELTVDVARRFGARFLLRGVRSVRDFEYERDMADLNFRLASLESVFLVAHPEMACICSSAVRDIASHGADVSGFIP